jgi:hypothetical protein
MWQKIEVIISSRKILSETFESNLAKSEAVQVFNLALTDLNILLELPKIDILILDEVLTQEIPTYNINNVINLTNTPLTQKDIFFKKPLKLAELVHIAHHTRLKDQLFCKVNNDFVFDEQMGKLLNQTSNIRLTEKENEIFKYLLLAADYKMAKEKLFESAWNYSSESNTTTFETHMSRLKQKLPQDLLQFKSNYYELNITNIV